MNKRGVALVLAFIVILVLGLLLGSVFLKTMNENNLAKRYVNSTRALWVAEAGVAQAVRNILGISGSGNLDSGGYVWISAFWRTIGTNDYYNIVSTGTVSLPSGDNVQRQISAVARTPAVDANRFPFSLVSSGDLCFGGNCKGDPTKYVHPQPLLPNPPVDPALYPQETVCPGGSCWNEKNTELNFLNLFGYQSSEIKSLADHVYTKATFPGSGISGVTWVDVPVGEKLSLTGGSGSGYDSPDGTGILIVNGDVEMAAGNYLFRGIIYVIGKFAARGTFDGYGSVVVQARTEIEESTINGTPDFWHSKYDIEQALRCLAANSAYIVSWKESTP